MAAAFPDATVYVHEKGARHLVDPTKLVDQRGDGLRRPARLALRAAHADRRERVHVLEDGDEIAGVGRTARSRPSTRPGTPSTTSRCTTPRAGLLFAGDAVGVRLPDVGILRPATPPPDFDLDQAIALAAEVRRPPPVRRRPRPLRARPRPARHPRGGRGDPAPLGRGGRGGLAGGRRHRRGPRRGVRPVELDGVDPERRGSARDAQRHPLQRRRLPPLARHATPVGAAVAPRRRTTRMTFGCSMIEVTATPTAIVPAGRAVNGDRYSGAANCAPTARRNSPCPKPSSSPPPAAPIGRANKGSLVDVPPRRPDRHHRQGRARQGPAARPARRSRTSSSAAASRPARRATTSPASPPSSPASTTCPASPSTATARRRCRRSAWPPTPSRPARATCSSPPASRPSAATCTASPTAARTTRSSPTPRPARAERTGGADVVGAADGPARHLHRHGPDRRERPAQAENVGREEMDEFAALSQQRAVANQENGFFEREITPVTTPDGTVVTKDDGPRAGTTVEKLAELKPVFRPDGEVTAGNACPLNDGAAAVIVMSDTKAARAGHHAAGPHRVVRRVRPQPRDHGPRPDRGLPPGAGPGRHDHRRHRPRRDQRGVRRPGHPVGQAPRHPVGQAQRQRRRHRPRATRSA